MNVDDLSERVTYWTRRLHLDPWTIHVSVVDESPRGRSGLESAAAVSTAQHYLTASMEFTRDWIEGADFKSIDVTIVHELLHCLFRDLDRAAEVAEDQLGGVMAELFSDRYNHELEQLIDRLAHTIVAINAE